MNLQRRFAVRSNFARGVTASLTIAFACVLQRRLEKLTDPRLHDASGGSLREQTGVCALRATENGAPKIYFNELLIEVNFVLSLEPNPFTAAMIAGEIPAAIRPYSMAVAAVSSFKNPEIIFTLDPIPVILSKQTVLDR
jgi:hypothetical protein